MPSVVSRADFAPVPVSVALVATVVPWTIVSIEATNYQQFITMKDGGLVETLLEVTAALDPEAQAPASTPHATAASHRPRTLPTPLLPLIRSPPARCRAPS